ncbi:NAD(P)H dehydrogenase (quinone) [Paenibacillus taihuensis]|uniref:NAD(P)H dehydrogenase (Quinone) n=1 Tax=Paenibacillus taihuensis TaxID=1156355 RepID=A0A3D9PY65_9BACL|nr:NAD(P)H-dependent oxidoreductase [Paenibacillus taihuensis]REE55469.1 NAD(P)H dehydrogenase (quinone) [Paenibacillus taihuensis]
MKHLVVIAHPNPDSFNHAIAKRLTAALQEKGHEVAIRDLYSIGFEAVLSMKDFEALRAGDIPSDIRTEQQFISDADVLTWIYPIWWTGLPAILKGYVDRVFAYGYAYKYGDGGNIEKLLIGKKGFTVNTHGTPKDIYDSIGMLGALQKTSDTGIFDFCGIETVGHLFFGSVPQVDDAEREGMLKQVEDEVERLF